MGAVLRLKGDWKHDSKYGKQFSATDYREMVPATIAGIEKYLGSGLFKGIGPINARRIVRHFKEDTLRIIEEAADELIQVEGIGKKRVNMIKKAWQEQKEIKNVMLFLQSSGVSTAYAIKIYKTYGNESISIVKYNPYRLADDIWGIGFKTADKIAQQQGFDKESYERSRSEIMYVLSELSNQGRCYATRVQLISEAVKILELEEPILAPLTMQHYMMLQRNLLYTCVTRANKVFVLVGTKKAIGIAVSTIRYSNETLCWQKGWGNYSLKLI